MKTVRQWDGGPETFCNLCPCRFSRPNWIKPWATSTHSELILLQPGCWNRNVQSPSQPESSHDPTHFRPCLSQGDRSPQVLFIKACNLPVPCCYSERWSSRCKDLVSHSCRNLLSETFLFTWRVLGRPWSWSRKLIKSMLRFILSNIFGKERRTRRSQLSQSLHNPLEPLQQKSADFKGRRGAQPLPAFCLSLERNSLLSQIAGALGHNCKKDRHILTHMITRVLFWGGEHTHI